MIQDLWRNIITFASIGLVQKIILGAAVVWALISLRAVPFYLKVKWKEW